MLRFYGGLHAAERSLNDHPLKKARERSRFYRRDDLCYKGGSQDLETSQMAWIQVENWTYHFTSAVYC